MNESGTFSWTTVWSVCLVKLVTLLFSVKKIYFPQRRVLVQFSSVY